jgi:hypothetical protein
MSDLQLQDIATEAERIYETRLKSELEASAPDAFVAIEPVSGEHFVGSTLSAAIQAAREAYPDRLAFALRVGHTAAVHVGSTRNGRTD